MEKAGSMVEQKADSTVVWLELMKVVKKDVKKAESTVVWLELMKVV